jgi:undecaprenyl-diphosphatase
MLFIGVLLPLILFGMAAEDVLGREVFPFDLPLLMFAHAHSTPFLDSLMYAATTAGSALVLVPVDCLIVACLFKWGRRSHAAFWAAAVVGAAIVNFAAKNFFGRIRPALWISRVHETSYSFPSGHAMSTMATMTALCVLLWPTRWRWLAIVAGSVFVALVGASRVYEGVHYPSDILAGWAASLAWVLGCKLLFGRSLAGREGRRLWSHAEQT